MIESTASARTKWCPMTRQVWATFEGDGTFSTLDSTPPFNAVKENRGSQDRRCPCISDDCLMWQELGTLQVEGASALHLGYCGLAGRPLLSNERAEIISSFNASPAGQPESEAP